MMKTLKWSMIASTVLAMVACGGDDPATSSESAAAGSPPPAPKVSSPDETVEAAVMALKNDDLGQFLNLMVPAEDIAEMRAEYDEERLAEEITDEKRAEFAAEMGRFTAPDAEAKLMAEIEPQLAQMGPQLPMMIGFGEMMVNEGIQTNEDFDDTRKQEAMAASTAMFSKLKGMNLTDVERAREAVGVFVNTARALDLETLDDLHAMEFDEMIGRGNTVLRGVKDVMNVYGIDIDAMLASVDAQVVNQTDDQANLQISYDLFGAPQTATANLVKKDGQWFSADMIEQIEKAAAADEMMEDEYGAAEEAATAEGG